MTRESIASQLANFMMMPPDEASSDEVRVLYRELCDEVLRFNAGLDAELVRSLAEVLLKARRHHAANPA